MVLIEGGRFKIVHVMGVKDLFLVKDAESLHIIKHTTSVFGPKWNSLPAIIVAPRISPSSRGWPAASVPYKNL
jgi:hypothetical protein